MHVTGAEVLRYQPFIGTNNSVKSRAAQPPRDAVLFSNDKRKMQVGQRYGIETRGQEGGYLLERRFLHQYDQLLQREKHYKYELISYGPGFLYFGKAPLNIRTPQGVVKSTNKADPGFAHPRGTTALDIGLRFSGPCSKGDTKGDADAIIGHNASNYARMTYGDKFAQWSKWAWIPLVDPKLGGGIEADNLLCLSPGVDGGLRAFEDQIAALASSATTSNPVDVQYRLDLYPNSRIATDVRLSVQTPAGKDASQSFRLATTLAFDKLLYDLWML